jgi:hypothetical protein
MIFSLGKRIKRSPLSPKGGNLKYMRAIKGYKTLKKTIAKKVKIMLEIQSFIKITWFIFIGSYPHDPQEASE